MTTLFNFVTVRNPRTPTKRELETGFIRYDTRIEAVLVGQLAEAWSSGGGADAVRDTVSRYRGTDAALTTYDQFAERMPALVDLADWLAVESSRVTWADIHARHEAHPVDVSVEDQRILWDNVIAHTYGGGQPELREALVWALRAVHVLQFEGERLEDDGSARRVAEATVLIPSESHGSLAKELPAEPPPADEPPDEQPDEAALKRERLSRLERLHRELSTALDDATDRSRTETVPPPVIPTMGADGCYQLPAEEPQSPDQPATTLDDAVIEGLDAELRDELGQIGIRPGMTLPYAMQQVEEHAGRLGAEIWRHASPTRSVVQVGGALWTRRRAAPSGAEPAAARMAATAPTSAKAMVAKRGELDYTNFYGAHEAMTHGDEPDCRIRPLGVADFRRVEQRICCYEPGEVAHIENVLKGETKERTTRRMLSTERTFTTLTESESIEERDSQTTDRLELERETKKASEFELSAELGVNIAAQYGMVKIQADTKFATSMSSKESDQMASRYAKEVTDRALERVVSKVREERSTRTLDEFEETNKHTLNAEDDHVVGLYRWVDKIYEAKIVNYGKRMMFEFLVPEPAAFHLHASITEPAEGTLTLDKPVDPRSAEAQAEFGMPPLTSHAAISETNYGLWAAAYGVPVEPPPTMTTTIGKAYHREGMDQLTQFADSKNDLKLPEGREAFQASAAFGLHSDVHHGGPNWITVMLGRRSFYSTSGTSFTTALDSEDDIVPVVLMGRTTFYAINVEVDCKRTAELFAKWQLKTYDAILRAYQDQLAAYNTALAAAQASVGIQIQGRNPLLNREIEQTELKKSCIRLLTRCADLPSDAMKDKGGDCDYPEFDCCEAIRDGSIVQFFEQLFEWRLMTYSFYPYFWGRKCNWDTIYQLDDADPLFLQFLQAGYARVVVPVREKYDSAALRYLADGAIWGGGTAPGVDSPMYVAMENELKEPVGTVDPDVEPWEIRVPTTLTVLQCESGCVDGHGLPCPCEDEAHNGNGDDDGDDGGNDDHGDDDNGDEDDDKNGKDKDKKDKDKNGGNAPVDNG